MVDSFQRFVADLGKASIGDTVNHYACLDPILDRPNAPAIRAANLLTYLEAHSKPTLLLVGEAAGYRGCRFSGIPFTSERSLLPSSWSSARADAWRESSATVVHRSLEIFGAEGVTMLWNAVPTHPTASGPLTNRPPSREELAIGVAWLERLIVLTRPTLVVAIGKSAASILPSGTPVVRHPANGGATAFHNQLMAILRERWEELGPLGEVPTAPATVHESRPGVRSVACVDGPGGIRALGSAG